MHVKCLVQDLISLNTSIWFSGLPRWLSGEESAPQCKRCGFNPWVRKIPWRRKWQPTPVFLPGKSHRKRYLVCYSPWSHKDLDMTEPTHTHTHLIFKTFWNPVSLYLSNHTACVVLSCFSHVDSLQSQWTAARQALLSIFSSGKNTGVGCHVLLQGIFPTQGLNPCHLVSPALAGRFFITSATWEDFVNLYLDSWRRKWQPTPVFLPGKFHGQRNLTDCSPWGCRQSDMTERLTRRL